MERPSCPSRTDTWTECERRSDPIPGVPFLNGYRPSILFELHRHLSGPQGYHDKHVILAILPSCDAVWSKNPAGLLRTPLINLDLPSCLFHEVRFLKGVRRFDFSPASIVPRGTRPSKRCMPRSRPMISVFHVEHCSAVPTGTSVPGTTRQNSEMFHVEHNPAIPHEISILMRQIHANEHAENGIVPRGTLLNALHPLAS